MTSDLYRHTVPDWSAVGAEHAPGADAVARAAADIATQVAGGKVPPLAITRRVDDLAPARDLSERISAGADHVLLIGIGGSSLGAQALSQIAGYFTPLGAALSPKPRVHFLENPDGPGLEALLKLLPPQRTHALVISKSGGTAEPMMQALAVIDWLKRAGLEDRIGVHMSVVTEPEDNVLARLAGAHGMGRLEHPTDIGGRFSVFSVVGLLPALLMGLDAEAVRAGAATVAQAFADDPAASPVSEGATFNLAAQRSGRRVHVLMPYTDRLERFAMWYRQIWAESLGKGGQGTLPVRALGPVDQHSQLQLYLDGPDDYAFAIVTEAQAGLGPRIAQDAAADPALSYLGGRTVGDLVMAEARATLETIRGKGRPVREFALEKVSERTIGALMAHFMLETVTLARVLGVDPYDQPAVEEGKILARKYLQEQAG